MRYGDASHWIMVNMTTMKGISSILTPAKDKINVKKSVDKVIMIATVPTKDKRSFHKFKKQSPIMREITASY